MRSFLRRLLLASAFYTVNAQGTCYWPNGEVAKEETPCKDGPGYTWCCGSVYHCASNQLCVHEQPAKDGTLVYGRGSCTDQTFQDNNCPKFCYTKDQFGWDSGSAVTRCKGEEEKYYCAVAETDIDCASYSGVFTMEAPTLLAPIVPTTTVTKLNSASTTSGQTTSTDESSNTTGNPNPTGGNSDGNSPGSGSSSGSGSNSVAIGVGVGVGIAFAIIVCFGIFMFLRHKKQKPAPIVPDPPKQEGFMQPQQYAYYQQPGYAAVPQPIYEASGSQPSRHEIQ